MIKPLLDSGSRELTFLLKKISLKNKLIYNVQVNEDGTKVRRIAAIPEDLRRFAV